MYLNQKRRMCSDMLWGVLNIACPLSTYAKDNGQSLKIDKVGRKRKKKTPILGEKPFKSTLGSDPQRKQMQIIAEYYKSY